MKSLLTTIAIVAALCLVSSAAPPDEAAGDATETEVPRLSRQREQQQQHERELMEKLRRAQDQSDQNRNRELLKPSLLWQPALDRNDIRRQYLRIIEQRVDSMSNAELIAALRDAKAEMEWRRAKSDLQDAADILDRIRAEYPGTEQAKHAHAILNVLSERGINGNRRRLPPASTDSPLSQVPASPH